MFNPSVPDSFDEMAFHCNYPIHRACRDGDVQTVSMVLQSNPSLSVTEDCFKHLTPIHWAAAFGKLDCIRQVASINPIVINVQSSDSFRTPLHCTSEAGHPHCLLWLLQAGANPEVKDIQGETALHKAARNGNAECVSLLIATSCSISTQNSNGQTASIIAEQAGYTDIANFIRQTELLMSDLQPAETRFGGFQTARFSRKRSRDVCDGTMKRIRTDETPVIMTPTIRHCMVYPMTTSVVEHERLCKMENGYINYFLDSMLSEIHGC